jgi:hypothetical protein
LGIGVPWEDDGGGATSASHFVVTGGSPVLWGRQMATFLSPTTRR